MTLMQVRSSAPPPGQRLRADEALRLDLADLGAVLAEPGTGATIRWSTPIRAGATVELELRDDQELLALTYLVEGEERVQKFAVERACQPFGGRRAWLLCGCGRRSRVLWCPTSRGVAAVRFACSSCHGGVTYASQVHSRDSLYLAGRAVQRLDRALQDLARLRLAPARRMRALRVVAEAQAALAPFEAAIARLRQAARA